MPERMNLIQFKVEPLFRRQIESEPYEQKAQGIVLHHLAKYGIDDVDIDDIRLFTFSKTLQNWKALLMCTAVNGVIFEVTYNGDDYATYVDTYTKAGNDVYYDHGPRNLTKGA